MEIGPWAETPAFLEDAHLRRFAIPLSLIDTWEVCNFSQHALSVWQSG